MEYNNTQFLYNKTYLNRIKLNEFIFYSAYIIYLVVSMIGASLLGASLGISNDFINTMKHIVAVLIVISILTNKKFNHKSTLFIAGIGLASLLVYVNMGAFNPILAILFLFGCRRCNPKRICKVHLYCISISLAIIFLSAILGIVDNIELSRGINTVRYGMGFKNATWFGYIFYLFVDYFCIEIIYNKRKIKHSEYLTVFIVTLIAFYLSKGRLEFISTFLLVIGVKYRRKIERNKTAKKVFIFSFIIMLALSILTTYMYIVENPLALSLNRLLNSRLMFNAIGYKQYGLSLFGNYVEMQGVSQTTAENWWNYFYIDNFYVSYFIQYGIVWMALTLFFLTLVNAKLAKGNKNVLLFFMAMVALQGFVVPTMMDFISSCTILVAFIETEFMRNKVLSCNAQKQARCSKTLGASSYSFYYKNNDVKRRYTDAVVRNN